MIFFGITSFPIVFVLFLIFTFIWQHHLHKNSRQHDRLKEAFWKKEEASLVVRKKIIPADLYYHPNLTGLDFIIPSYISQEQKHHFLQLKRQLIESASQPMLSFPHTSNTDLRLTYGTANISLIESAENNYNHFLNLLFNYAKWMNENDRPNEAIVALEECIRLDSEVSSHYFLLADLYSTLKKTDSLLTLHQKATSLECLTKDKIIRYLESLIV